MINSTNYLFKTLEKQGVEISPWVEQAYPRALAQASMAEGPLYIPFDKNHISFLYTPDTGAAAVLGAAKQSGRHGSVIKVVTEKALLAYKTIIMKEDRDLIRFKREHDALKALGLLKWVKWPTKVGDEGEFMFPFCEGVTLKKYLESHASVENGYEIALLIIVAVQHFHRETNYTHKSLHHNNILIDSSKGAIKVHLIDFGRALPYSDADDGYDDDIRFIKRVCGEILLKTPVTSNNASRETYLRSELTEDFIYQSLDTLEMMRSYLVDLLLLDMKSLASMSEGLLINLVWCLLAVYEERYDPRLPAVADALVTLYGPEALEVEMTGNEVIPYTYSVKTVGFSPLSFCRTAVEDTRGQLYFSEWLMLQNAAMKYHDAPCANVTIIKGNKAQAKF